MKNFLQEAYSQRQPHKQKAVLLQSLALRFDKLEPLPCIRGCMLESFLQGGSCTIAECKNRAQYGKSITDPCMSWEMTEDALEKAAKLFLQ